MDIKIGDRVRTLKMGQMEGEVTGFTKKSGITKVVFQHESGKSYATVPSNLEVLETTAHGDEFYEGWGWLRWPETQSLMEAEYQGKKVTLNKPIRSSNGPKKFHVYVKNDKGNVVKVNFGDPDMKIRKSNPKARKSFRARHNCDDAKDRTSARYWSCRQWNESSDDDPCWDGYEMVGMKQKNGRDVPNCVPESVDLSVSAWHREFESIIKSRKQT